MTPAAIIFLVFLVVFFVHGAYYGEPGPRGWGGPLIVGGMFALLGWRVFNL